MGAFGLIRRVTVVVALVGSLLIPAIPAGAQGPVTVPAGFEVGVFFSGLNHPTNMTFGPDGRLWVTTEGDGAVHILADRNGDGVGDEDRLFASGFDEPLGVASNAGNLYVSSRGKVTLLRDNNGDDVPDVIADIITGLPNGRHQNDSIVVGSDAKLYLGNGSTSDLGPEANPLSATILRANLDGSGMEVYARGLRNPYGLAFDGSGHLFATDNGPDAIPAPDELNQIVQGGDYGFPQFSGAPPANSGTIGPVATFEDHSAATGLAFYTGSQFPPEFQGNVFVTLWGATIGPVPAGHKMVRVQLQPSGNTFTGQVSDFATGLANPIDVVMGPAGDLFVADYGAGTIYRIFRPSDVIFFPQTGNHLGFGFRAFWQNNGGLPIFGFPVSEEFQQNGLTMQWFERARFEFHPDLVGTPFSVQLGLLGREATAGRQGEPPFQPVPAFPNGPDRRYFPETGHSLSFGFKAFWDSNGGLPIFGFPIGEEFVENGLTVQYFERARFEFHPDLVGTPFSVQLGLLGDQALHSIPNQ